MEIPTHWEMVYLFWKGVLKVKQNENVYKATALS